MSLPYSFLSNRVTGQSYLPLYDSGYAGGGAVWMAVSTFTIGDHCTFHGNSAIYEDGSDVVPAETTAHQVLYENNSSGNDTTAKQAGSTDKEGGRKILASVFSRSKYNRFSSPQKNRELGAQDTGTYPSATVGDGGAISMIFNDVFSAGSHLTISNNRGVTSYSMDGGGVLVSAGCTFTVQDYLVMTENYAEAGVIYGGKSISLF